MDTLHQVTSCLPVKRDGHQGEDARRHRHVGDEIVDGAINGAKRPVAANINESLRKERDRGFVSNWLLVEHESKVEDAIKERHGQIGQTQIDLQSTTGDNQLF